MGRYEAVRMIGEGATSQVWQGIGPGDRPVAIKLYRADPAASALAAGREAALNAQVDHPHLPAVLEVVTDGTQVALVTEFAGGGSLADLLGRRARLSAGEVLTVILPVAGALATAHERGVVHGDLSPANILFDVSGRPMLADLGAARAAVETGLPVAATPGYVAPEVARGTTPDAAADLFALGAIALHCLTGRPAWNAEDLRDVVIQSTAGQWPDLENGVAPESLTRVVRALLDPEPAQRPGGATVAVALRDAGRPEPIELTDSGGGSAAGPVRAATMLRADAVNSAPEEPARRRHRRVRGVSKRAVTTAVVVIAALLVGIGAVQLGLWWAGADQAKPAANVAAPSGSPASNPAPTRSTPNGAPNRPVPNKPAPNKPVPNTPGMTKIATPPAASATMPAGSPLTTPAGKQDWAAVMSQLDVWRSAALVARDPGLLDRVYVPGSAERAADAETIAALAKQRIQVAGAVHQVESVRMLSNSGDRWQVEVVDSLPAYAITDHTGAVVGRTEARAGQKRIFDLAMVSGHYRIAAVRTG